MMCKTGENMIIIVDVIIEHSFNGKSVESPKKYLKYERSTNPCLAPCNSRICNSRIVAQTGWLLKEKAIHEEWSARLQFFLFMFYFWINLTVIAFTCFIITIFKRISVYLLYIYKESFDAFTFFFKFWRLVHMQRT